MLQLLYYKLNYLPVSPVGPMSPSTPLSPVGPFLFNTIFRFISKTLSHGSFQSNLI